MGSRRVVRILVAAAGAAVILALGVYVPATLLGPLPAATWTVLEPDAAAVAAPPTLPDAGSSAVLDAAGDPDLLSASAGSKEPRPIASVAKLALAAIVLDSAPLGADEEGPAVPITDADLADYVRYSTEGSRAIVVFPGESWSEREVLQATLLGSSNNHADTLARWAFGSVDGYLSAADAWLSENGLADTRLVDATGLSSSSTSTAADIARLASIALDEPAVEAILEEPVSSVQGRTFTVTTSTDVDGITVLSRSYTDEAGVCVVLRGASMVGEESYEYVGVLLGEPDQDTAEADIAALQASALAGIGPVVRIAAGSAYARLTTAWGDEADAVASRSVSGLAWSTDMTTAVDVTVSPSVSTGAADELVGSVQVGGDSGDEVGLRLATRLSDPGPAWRLTNPAPVIEALLASWS